MSFNKERVIMAEFFMTGKKMRLITVFSIILVSLVLTQCTSYDFSRRIIQQGNLLPYSKIERIKIGMSKEDIAILMGTSMLSPIFNNDRWDYAYTWRRGTGGMQMRNAVLYFRGNTLVKIEHKP